MEENVSKRVMPHSIEAEQSVIASMLMENDAVAAASEILTGEDFYQQRCGIIFDAIVDLYKEGKAVDPITVRSKLRDKNVPEEMSDPQFIRELLLSSASSVNIRDYAAIVSEKSALRKLIRTVEEVGNKCYMEGESVDELFDEAERKLFRIFSKRTTAEFTPIGEVVVDTLEQINKAYLAKGNVTGLATGFADLDNNTAGFQNSDLILIAARPSMGKTALALNIAQYMALKKGKSVAIFSLEMSKNQLMNRIISMETGIDATRLRTGKFKQEDWSKIVNTGSRIADSGLIIDDTPGLTAAELRSKCRRYKLEHGLDIIFIDYIQLMSSSKRNVESRQQEITEISRSLKALARELDVPIVALSQLNRSVEARADHRPMLSDLRESGAIEQDADIVMFIYRDDYYNKDSDKRGVAELIIAKQRNGPTGTVELAWQQENTRFRNIERIKADE